ncbi:hypothetical protein NC652_018458 [Populus alba x Populus x berolinensis]|uniref:Uncharacterized protein n=1 Tax=Populus alba x Populus x berolinensis TaxID=444605 RepID=A0AAD6QG71_9ROSI|nr:hypothetical protein NC652_018458 [Populus alba x Populus x berolinensis]KAJ6989812.1 hypothetical protein NC653_018348 [Populus alba x Populus x berolinensis]
MDSHVEKKLPWLNEFSAGKPHASSASDEKLEVLRKYEQGKIDKLLSEYIAFRGKDNQISHGTCVHGVVFIMVDAYL